MLITWKKTMKLHNKLILALSASTLLAGAVSATTLDYRHEYREDGNQVDRVKLGDGWKINNKWKTNISFEIKFQSEDNDDGDNDALLNRSYLTAAEVDMGLTYKINKNWVIKPGMPILLDDNENTFKPQVRLQHKSDFGLTSALRVRYEIHNYVNDYTKGNMDDEDIKHEHKLKITYTGAYKIKKFPDLKVSWEANYWESLDNVHQANEENWDYDYGLIIGYQLGDFRPYAEFWNIKDGNSDKTTAAPNGGNDHRQGKYRIGIKYYF